MDTAKASVMDDITFRLSEAGWELFREKRYSDVLIDDICKKAGLSKGAFYHRFSCKEAFFSETYVRHLRRALDSAMLEAAVLYPTDISRQLVQWTTAYVSFAHRSGQTLARYFLNLFGEEALGRDGEALCLRASERLRIWQTEGHISAEKTPGQLWRAIDGFARSLLRVYAETGDDNWDAHAQAFIRDLTDTQTH